MTPQIGDVWEWTGETGTGHVLLEEIEGFYDQQTLWRVLFLETGRRARYTFSPENAHLWRKVA